VIPTGQILGGKTFYQLNAEEHCDTNYKQYFDNIIMESHLHLSNKIQLKKSQALLQL